MKRILIADPHAIVRLGLNKLFIDRFSNYEIEEVADLASMNALLERATYHLVILEATILGVNHVKTLSSLKTKYPSLKMLIFTSIEESLYAFPFMKAGADGFLSKNADQEEIETAINTIIIKDKRYLSETLKDESIQMMIGAYKPKGPSSQELSSREKDVFRLLLNGKGIKDIGALLNLHVSTVSTYRSRIFEKYGVTNIVDLVKSVKESELE